MGPDEVRARQLLLDMMELLSRDPYEALGLIPSATASDIRNAFLTKTKQFHPARFGRMAGDIQRLANEVFLSLRAAHENLARPTTKPPALRPGSPVPRALGSAGMPRAGTGAPPPAVPAASPARPATGPIRTIGSQPVARASTQAGAPSGRTSEPQTTQQQQLRPGMPARPGQPPPTRQPGRMPSPSPQPQAARPGNGGARPAAPAAPAPRAGTGPIDRDLVPIYELIAQDQLGQAKAALETLIARTPQSTKAKALLAYAKGRAAQLENRIDDARVELNEALLLDKDLQLAKTAFAELMSRRR